MARITPLEDHQVPPESRPEFERQLAAHGRVTNMKRTLARNATAFEALMTWYPLHDTVTGFLGQRAALVFAQAVSEQADCLICSTYFRRLLIQAGDPPDALRLDPREATLTEFGKQLARDAHAVSEAMMERLRAFLTPDQIVTLTAFGAIMLATNVFNNALQVDLDEYLLAYRKPPADSGTGSHA